MQKEAAVFVKQNYTIINTLQTSTKGRVCLIRDTDGHFFVLKETQRTGLPYKELADISNPIIPHIYKVFENSTGTVVIEEYIEGKTLDDVSNERALSETEIRSYALQVCRGLAVLHSHHILHRDIKPSNLILTPQSNIVLIDFDAARITKPEADQDTRYFGTKGFAPPEQFGYGQTDARSDIYALGMTMKALLPPDTPSALDEIIAKATRLDPADRFQSAGEMAEALEKGLRVLGAQATGHGSQFSGTGEKIILVLLACILAVGIGWFTLREKPVSAPPTVQNMPPFRVSMPKEDRFSVNGYLAGKNYDLKSRNQITITENEAKNLKLSFNAVNTSEDNLIATSFVFKAVNCNYIPKYSDPKLNIVHLSGNEGTDFLEDTAERRKGFPPGSPPFSRDYVLRDFRIIDKTKPAYITFIVCTDTVDKLLGRIYISEK